MKVLYLTLSVVFIDQFSKLLVKGFSFPLFNISHGGMELNSTIEVIQDIFKITYVENPGMAFGIDIGGKLYFTIFRLIASIGILAYLYHVRKEKLILRLPLALILGGAIGNFIDRAFYGVLFNEGELFHGKVVDFIFFPFIKINFLFIHLNGMPIFNIADLAVLIGVLMLIIFHKKITETAAIEQNEILKDSLSINEINLPNSEVIPVINNEKM